MNHKTDNVLVSREKFDAMVASLNRDALFNFGNFHSAKKILDMPDFIESKRDLHTLQMEIDGAFEAYPQSESPEAQAAINALQYKKEGE
jgi:hypothetical protein